MKISKRQIAVHALTRLHRDQRDATHMHLDRRIQTNISFKPHCSSSGDIRGRTDGDAAPSRPRPPAHRRSPPPKPASLRRQLLDSPFAASLSSRLRAASGAPAGNSAFAPLALRCCTMATNAPPPHTASCEVYISSTPSPPTTSSSPFLRRLPGSVSRSLALYSPTLLTSSVFECTSPSA